MPTPEGRWAAFVTTTERRAWVLLSVSIVTPIAMALILLPTDYPLAATIATSIIWLAVAVYSILSIRWHRNRHESSDASDTSTR